MKNHDKQARKDSLIVAQVLCPCQCHGLSHRGQTWCDMFTSFMEEPRCCACGSHGVKINNDILEAAYEYRFNRKIRLANNTREGYLD